MVSVMFICHGNICRSPMAEMIFLKMMKDSGLADQCCVASAATSREEILGGVGNPVYPSAKRVLAAHGIPCHDHRATQLTKQDYSTYDYLICMDDNNVRNARHLVGDAEHKLIKLMDLTDRPGNVADPWYSDDFETAYRDIEYGCRALLEKLVKEEIV